MTHFMTLNSTFDGPRIFWTDNSQNLLSLDRVNGSCVQFLKRRTKVMQNNAIEDWDSKQHLHDSHSVTCGYYDWEIHFEIQNFGNTLFHLVIKSWKMYKLFLIVSTLLECSCSKKFENAQTMLIVSASFECLYPKK